jgi:hypothetical protein
LSPVLVRAFSKGVRRAATALWGIGAGLAATSGVLAVAHSELGYGVLYALVAAALATLAAATQRGNRAAHFITLLLLGSQVIGALGAAWEFAHGADDTAKARHLHDLGVNYRLALAGNLAFSTLASAVFVWAVVRVIRGRPEP